MKVSYDLTADDLTAFVRYHHIQSPTARKQRIASVFVGLLVTLALPALLLVSADKPLLETTVAIWPLLLAPLGFLAVVGPYMKWKTERIAKRMLKEGANSGFYGDCKLSLETDGIREIKRSGESTRKWSAVERIVLSPEHVFVYTAGFEAFVVPRRAFANDSELRDFVGQIADRSRAPVQRG